MSLPARPTRSDQPSVSCPSTAERRRPRPPALAVVVATIAALVVAAAPGVAEGGGGSATAGEGCDAVAWFGRDASGVYRVWGTDVDGGIPTLIPAPAPAGYPGPGQLAWSPDGSALAWAVWDGSRRDIAVARGNVTTRVSDTGDPADPTGNYFPAFSPDGTRIAWVGSGQVHVAALDGTGRVSVSTVGPDPDPTNAESPVWSPDGTRIAWAGRDPSTASYQIFAADPDGTDRIVVSTADADPDPNSNRSPVWSPDGTRVAWVGWDPSRASYQIFAANADGTERMVVSSSALLSPTDNWGAVWSSDGTRIAWVGTVGGLGTHVWVAGVTVDRTQGPQKVSPGFGAGIENSNPTWSPDGTRLAWSSFDGTTRHIVVAAPDGSDPVDVSSAGPDPAPTFNDQPAWSPDGSRIAWRGYDPSTGTNEIVVASVDGSGRTVVSAAPGGPHPTDALWPVWQPRDIDEVSFDATAVGAVTTGESVTVTVSATTARCGQGRLTLSGLDLPCVEGETVTVTAGSVVGSTWTLDRLAPGEAPAATITGRVGTVGDCALTVTLHGERSAPRVVAKALGWADVPTCPSDPSPFTDVAPESFARGDVDCIHALGLTRGTGPSTYSPSAPVTRAQMAVFLARFWRVLDRTCPTARSPFVDVDTGDFGAREVDCVYGMGVTTGTSPSTFSPWAPVTREQMAAFLARTWRALGGVCPSSPAPFVDIGAGSFARGDVDCIFALGVTTGTSPSTFSPSAPVTREQMAAFLARLWRRAVADGLHLGDPAG